MVETIMCLDVCDTRLHIFCDWLRIDNDIDTHPRKLDFRELNHKGVISL